MEDKFNQIDNLISQINTFNSANDFNESCNLYLKASNLLNEIKSDNESFQLNNLNKKKNKKIDLDKIIAKIETEIDFLSNKNFDYIEDNYKKITKLYQYILLCKNQILDSKLEINEIIRKNNDFDIKKFD